MLQDWVLVLVFRTFLYRQSKLYFKTAFKCHLKAIQIQIFSSHAQNFTKQMNSEPEVRLHDYKLYTAATDLINEQHKYIFKRDSK